MPTNFKAEKQVHSSDNIAEDFVEITKDDVPYSMRDDLSSDSEPLFNQLPEMEEEPKHTSPLLSSSRSQSPLPSFIYQTRTEASASSTKPAANLISSQHAREVHQA